MSLALRFSGLGLLPEHERGSSQDTVLFQSLSQITNPSPLQEAVHSI